MFVLVLAKAYDKVKWENLQETLSEHAVSDHILRVLKRMYYGQAGRIGDNSTDGDLFCIRESVRQGCALSQSSVFFVCFGNSVWVLASENWQWRHGI